MKLSDKASVKQVIASMSLEDKLRAIQGATIFKTNSVPEHGIPEVYMLDGGTGMCFMQTTLEAMNNVRTDGKVGLYSLGSALGQRSQVMPYLYGAELTDDVPAETRELVLKLLAEMEKLIPDMVLPGCFPPGIVFGASWDGKNIYESGVALGKETHYYKIDVLLGTPNVNIHRDPLNGRLFEGYSEDPVLVSKLAPEFVKGIQSEGIIANAKHYAANNQETNRRGIDEKIQERALREIYLPGFNACVDAGCGSLMSAYNSINGIPCAHHDWLQNKVLRDEWGFEGFIVSDWGAVYDQVDALNGGNDFEMPINKGIDELVVAVKDGRLKEEVVDTALERYLNQIVNSIAMKGQKYTTIDREGSRKAAYNSAKEGMVLLKNEGVLPLGQDASVCFYGERSKKFIESGGGSANVVTNESTSMYSELEAKLGAGKVTFENITDETDVVIITAGSMGSEGFDRQAMDLDIPDKAMLLDAVKAAKNAGKKVLVVLNVCGPVDMREYIDDTDAVVCIFYPGQEGGRVMAEMLMGEINPSGKLPLTFPKRYEDCPSSTYFPGRNLETWYGEGIFVGYRWYDYRQIEPLFPFGFGMSYTTFELTSATLDKNVFKYDTDKGLALSAKVKNTGNMTGKEVVQIYIGQEGSTLVKPVKELKDFCKVELNPGEEKSVNFCITKEMLQSYDEEIGGWAVEPGKYHIYVGTSSRQIAYDLCFTADGWNSFGFNENTPLDKIAYNSEAFGALQSYCPEGTLSLQDILAAVMLRKADTVAEFWKNRVEPKLSPEENNEKYAKMLADLNRFQFKPYRGF